MASPSSSQTPVSPAASSDEAYHLKREVTTHEVALQELNSLSSTRSIYVKKGNIFFHTSIEKAMTFEQGQLASAKRKLQKLDNK